MPLYRLLVSATFLFCTSLAAQIAPAITTDPAPDKDNPAGMQSFQLPSHGALLNAFVYIASGPGTHQTAILLHGFPGNEKNLDVAQAIRRDGWNVLYFDYRGSWGSPGDFSFTHSIEDVQAAIAYMHDPTNAQKFHSDPNFIVLIGHSMGGFPALQAGAADPSIKAIITISAADFSISRLQALSPNKHDEAVKGLAAGLAAEGMAPLAGCTPDSLANEIIANKAKWDFVGLAPKLSTRRMLVITSDDGLTPSNDALVEALHKAGDINVTAIHIPTDHSYSDHRITLQREVLQTLDSILAPPHPSNQ